MSKRRKRIVLLAFGILALAMVWALLRDREPSHQGRTLSEWVEQAGPAYLWADSDEQVNAVRAIGTNGFPTILKWISYRPSPFRKKMAELTERLPFGIGPDSISFAEECADRAVTVFHILGPHTRAAIPELTRLALTAPDQRMASRCIIALTHLGPQALPSALALVTNSLPHKRSYAILTVHAYGTNAAVAVPILVDYLDSKESWIAEGAASTLSGFGSLRSVVVQRLTNAMRSLSTQTRVRAVEIIFQTGAPAGEAVPALLPLLTDPEYAVRDATTNVLLQIAPEVLTNVPPQ